jgi:hypothetical protein
MAKSIALLVGNMLGDMIRDDNWRNIQNQLNDLDMEKPLNKLSKRIVYTIILLLLFIVTSAAALASANLMVAHPWLIIVFSNAAVALGFTKGVEIAEFLKKTGR